MQDVHHNKVTKFTEQIYIMYNMQIGKNGTSTEMRLLSDGLG